MGNNQAYRIFEKTVVLAYDTGKLDKDILAAIMKPYEGCDIDSGGSTDPTTKDGLDAVDVVLKVMLGLEVQKPGLPENYQDWTPEHERANETYHETRDNAFSKITDQFGWE